MMSIDRILCPSNLPFEFDETLSYAVSLARAFKANLIIQHGTNTSSLRVPRENSRTQVAIVNQQSQQFRFPKLYDRRLQQRQRAEPELDRKSVV